MVRSAWFACIALAIVPLAASAEGPVGPDPGGAGTLDRELPAMVPRLLLTWPIEAKRVSFNLGQPSFELRSLQRVELDCRLSCQPVLEHALGFEARLQLGRARALPENHLFARSAAILSTLRVEQRQTFGLGGLLDL